MSGSNNGHAVKEGAARQPAFRVLDGVPDKGVNTALTATSPSIPKVPNKKTVHLVYQADLDINAAEDISTVTLGPNETGLQEKIKAGYVLWKILEEAIDNGSEYVTKAIVVKFGLAPIILTTQGRYAANEKNVIEVTLREARWNQRTAAKILGISYNTLRRRIKQYNIKGR